MQKTFKYKTRTTLGEECQKAESYKMWIRSLDVRLRRNHESEAGLVREELLINIPLSPNWRDAWKTTRNKKKTNKKNNKSFITVFSWDFVALYLSALKEERRGLLRCYKSGGDLQRIESRTWCSQERLQKDKEQNCWPLCERGIKQQRLRGKKGDRARGRGQGSPVELWY